MTAISAGSAHSLALKRDGTVVAWGCGGDGGSDDGQCNLPAGLSGVTAIAAGNAQSLALKSDGTVVAWGCAGFDHGQCSVPSGLSGVTAIAAGNAQSLALKSDGTVIAWGCGPGVDLGQCKVPAGLSGVTAISAGAGHSLALVALEGSDDHVRPARQQALRRPRLRRQRESILGATRSPSQRAEGWHARPARSCI